MPDSSPLQQQADLFRASGALGKPGALSRLFDYLLERSLAGEAPKELEIAFKVFGKDSRFDVAQDSVVRVYVHKLRRRLDDYYAAQPAPAAARLTIPKGEYRLTIELGAAPAPSVAQEIPESRIPKQRAWIGRVALVMASIAIGALVTFLLMRHDGGDVRLDAVRASRLWAPLLADDLPITIVVGDYYLLGETDDSGRIQRLVREFFVNSADDFVHQVEASPRLMERYRNLNLTYLPTSTAFALQDIIPVLDAKKRVRVLLMSELNGSMLTNSHLVYIGFFSGLGILGDPALAASRLSLGGTFDELIDRKSNRTYVSTAGDPSESRYVDYGFVSTFPGPGKNRVVIIAGTRDTGVMHMAEAVASPAALAEIDKQAGDATAFESLFEVHGVARSGMTAKALYTAPLDTQRIWEMR
ncbi:hypothetical protein HNQ60_003061 [Povalibacter uvarum]|uniref:Uncharacterized protein n=1 Tax=Povalibacter uvarum TaxID=732238 RepID=A0A841HPL5_9GAMM|nr:hypothetical protein [Povalibacter uvarum]MBB6094180.1 hypothetical protein [Povalibacter uvarum]